MTAAYGGIHATCAFSNTPQDSAQPGKVLEEVVGTMAWLLTSVSIAERAKKMVSGRISTSMSIVRIEVFES